MSSTVHMPPLAPAAQRALYVLEEAGFEAWCVGGFVRDCILGRAHEDVDIATNALWPEVQRVFEAAGCRTHETGVAHGTLTVCVDGSSFEITTYRTEGAYTDLRHPDSVAFVTHIEDDLARRDFTMNALAYHPDRGLLDPYGGLADIGAGTIRAVGSPDRRFAEDALRILRACRFASQLGFSLDASTERGMDRCRGGLAHIAAERIAAEMGGFLCGAYVHDALMECIDVLGEVIPELLPMKGFDQKTPYHVYDVLEHTAYVIQNTPAYPLVRWAALFHDMGKPRAFFTDEAGIGHFYGHAQISIELAGPAMRRLKLPPGLVHDTLLLVRYHDEVIPPTPKAVKRMLYRLEGRPGLFRALTDLKRADALSQAPRCRARVGLADGLDRILDKILAAEEAFSLKHLAIKGRDLIAMDIGEGPEIGRLLDGALEAVIDGRIPNEREALLAFVGERSTRTS